MLWDDDVRQELEHEIQMNAISFLHDTTIRNSNEKYNGFFQKNYMGEYCFSFRVKINKLKLKRGEYDEYVRDFNSFNQLLSSKIW